MTIPSPTAPQPVRLALEMAFVVFFFSVISAILATGAPYPPTAASLYYPGLVAVSMAIAYYAGARHIALPPSVPP